MNVLGSLVRERDRSPDLSLEVGRDVFEELCASRGTMLLVRRIDDHGASGRVADERSELNDRLLGHENQCSRKRRTRLDLQATRRARAVGSARTPHRGVFARQVVVALVHRDLFLFLLRILSASRLR
jgi:hypothetical protein